MRNIFIIFLLFLTACSSNPREDQALDLACPKIGFVKNSDVKEIAENNIKLEFEGMKGECSYEDQNILLDIILPFKAKGDAEKIADTEISAKYFIALLSENDDLLLKKIFDTSFEFDDEGKAESEEEHEIELPIKISQDADKYKIILGFVKED